MDALQGLPLAPLTSSGVLLMVVLLVLTDKLIWHKRLTKAETERDEWRDTALKALGVADKLTVQGEVTTAIVASMPDPGRKE